MPDFVAARERWLTALVPMKQHSDRVPRKNFRRLGDRPLCHWILGTLEEMPLVQRIVVNTDSEKIARIVLDEFEVTLHVRPERLRGDGVSMNRIIENDLDRLEEGEHFLQTHATNPFVSAATLQAAAEAYFTGLEAGRDSLFAVTRHQSRFYDADGRPVNHDPERLIPTQELAPLYEENSNFYLFSRPSFRKVGRRIGAAPGRFEVPPDEALDIDDPWEWRLAEMVARDADRT